MTNFRDKKIALVGLGQSNLALAKFLKSQGTKRIIGCDQKIKPELFPEFQKLKIDTYLGKGYLKNLSDFDFIFLSPGVSRNLGEFKKAQKEGRKISSEIKLFFELCPCPIVGITGTNGKSTVTKLVGEILKKSQISNLKSLPVRQAGLPRPVRPTGGRQAGQIFIGGNIGEPLIDKLDKIKKDDLVVLELSSFQLENLKKSPYISVLLNISPDHLDRYQNFKDYWKAKKNILKYQKKSDFAVLNLDNPLILKLIPQLKSNIFPYSIDKKLKKGAFLENGLIKVRWNKNEQIICSVDVIKLLGRHNLSNILSAVAVATILKIPPKLTKKAISEFKGLPHRLEFVKEIAGVEYYNDSKSTTPESTIAALNSFPEGKIILIAGGYDKHISFTTLAKVILKKTKSLILIGETAKKIGEVVRFEQKRKPNKTTPQIYHGRNLEKAVELAKKISQPGDIILLSPACASFDMFSNFEERGKLFKKFVGELNKIEIKNNGQNSKKIS